MIYPGAVPLETDLLNAQKNDMVGLSKLAAAVLGTTTQVNGLTVAPNSPAALNVVVSPGEIYSLQNIDGTAYSSIAADTTHQILKQGIFLDAVILATAAPGTAGQSVNYLIQATFTESDTTPVVLPYYNASNPAIAYSGPANAGTTNNTKRQGLVAVSAKAGIAAATGSQTTPAPDSGYVGLYTVTVANGQTTVTAGNISTLAAAPFTTNIPALLSAVQNISGRLLNIQTFTATGTYTPTAGTKSVVVEVQGGGAAGGGAPATAAGQSSIGSGGGAGAFGKGRYTTGFSGVTVTVGAGGAGVSGLPGGNGSGSSFGALLTAPGGSQGTTAGPANAPFGITGSSLSGAAYGGTIFNGQGSSGGIATSAVGCIVSGVGGNSNFGAGGPIPNSGSTGIASASYGAGGSGAYQSPSGGALAGGAGMSGLVIVHEYA